MRDIPKFSVVIPTYNQAQYLAEAVQGVLDQTCRDFEAIVVDDGSTDDTTTVARRFGSKIRYVRQDNQGLACARNSGIRQAQGEYVALLDSDDRWEPAFLERMNSLVSQAPGAAIYYCGARCIDADGHELPQLLTPPVGPPGRMRQALLRGNSLVPSAVVLQRSSVVEVGLFDQGLRSIEDWDL